MTAWDDNVQPILNACPVSPRNQQHDFPHLRNVTAQVQWQADGWETLTTTAEAWSGPLVLVNIQDPRSQLRGIWLRRTDVTPCNDV